MTPAKRRKNWTAPEVGRMSTMILQMQYRGTHVCDIHEHRQFQYVNSIKLCAGCNRQFPFEFFRKSNHSISGVYTAPMCEICETERLYIRQLDKNIIKRQFHNTHVSDLFEHYSGALVVAFEAFDNQCNKTRANDARAELKAAKNLPLHQAVQLDYLMWKISQTE